MSEEAFEFNYNRSTSNPFADYLRSLAEKIDDPGIINLHDFIYERGALKHFPEFMVCGADLEKLIAESRRISVAITFGLLRIDRIPEELWADDAVERRHEWLEEQMTEETKKQLDDLLSLSLDLGLPEDGGKEAE